MKIIAAAVLFAALSTSAVAQKKPTPQPASIPVPTCPPSDPNGCGIYQW